MPGYSGMEREALLAKYSVGLVSQYVPGHGPWHKRHVGDGMSQFYPCRHVFSSLPPPFRRDSSAGRGSGPPLTPFRGPLEGLALRRLFFFVVCHPLWFVSAVPFGSPPDFFGAFSVCRSLASPPVADVSCRPFDLGLWLWLTPFGFSDASTPLARRFEFDV